MIERALAAVSLALRIVILCVALAAPIIMLSNLWGGK